MQNSSNTVVVDTLAIQQAKEIKDLLEKRAALGMSTGPFTYQVSPDGTVSRR